MNKFTKLFFNFIDRLHSAYQNTDAKVGDSVRQGDTAELIDAIKKAQSERDRVESLAHDLEKFKLAVEGASDHISITDIDGMVLYVNKAVEKITGYGREEVVGKKAGSLWKLPMPQEYYQNMWDTIKTQKKSFIGELRNRKKDGTVYISSINIFPVLDKGGAVLFFVGIERDITREKQIDTEKTEFVSLASHQLRTPLTAINWYSEMLLDGDAGTMTERQKQYIEEIHTSGQRLIDLVTALLNISRVERGTLTVSPEPIDIIESCEAIIKELTPQINKKHITIMRQFETGMPIMKVDRSFIGIVFQNLITNAIEYTREGGFIVVAITRDGKNLLCSVADNGIGIPVDAQSRIFEKMYRADNAMDMKSDGNGLGLYLVRSIIERNNGNIWFISEQNKGTTFLFTLPLSGMLSKEGTKTLVS